MTSTTTKLPALKHSDLLGGLTRLASAAELVGELEVRAPLKKYLPTIDWLDGEFAAGRRDRRAVLATYATEVRLRWNGLKGDSSLLAELDDLAPKEALVPAPIPDIHAIKDFDFRLEAARIKGTMPGRAGPVPIQSVVELVTSAQSLLLDDVADTPARAVETVMRVRAFDDLVIRLSAAKKAAADLQLTLGEVLTLYRQECGFFMYPSLASLEAGVPSAAPLEVFRSAAEPGERSRVSIRWRPSPHHGYWLADAAAPRLRALSGGALSVDQLKVVALATFYLGNTLGSDNVASQLSGFIENGDFPGARDQFVTLGTRYWAASQLPATLGTATAIRKRWDDLLANLSCKPSYKGLAGDQAAAVLITPVDPVFHLTELLKDGMAVMMSKRSLKTVMLLSRDPQVTSLADSDLPPAMTYARHNLQFNDTDFRQMLASAARDAHRVPGKKGPPLNHPHRRLWKLIDDSGEMKAFLEGFTYVEGKKPRKPRASDPVTANAYQTLLVAWQSDMLAAVGRGDADPADYALDGRFWRWLRQAENRARLFDFVQLATLKQWLSWHKVDKGTIGKVTASVREHVMNYRLTRKYFDMVFEGAAP